MAAEQQEQRQGESEKRPRTSIDDGADRDVHDSAPSQNNMQTHAKSEVSAVDPV